MKDTHWQSFGKQSSNPHSLTLAFLLAYYNPNTFSWLIRFCDWLFSTVIPPLEWNRASFTILALNNPRNVLDRESFFWAGLLLELPFFNCYHPPTFSWKKFATAMVFTIRSILLQPLLKKSDLVVAETSRSCIILTETMSQYGRLTTIIYTPSKYEIIFPCNM